MSNLTISIFGNQIFLVILNELKILSKYEFVNFNNFDLCLKEAKKHKRLIVFFNNSNIQKINQKITEIGLPLLLINNKKKSKKDSTNDLIEELNMPFKILDFEKKIVTLLAKYQFSKSSLIHLGNYVINKNERKIKKNNLELKLTEKEIDFLILFTKNTEPLERNFVLKKVWNYSSETDTHTIETHIHRLRKKILQKFKDNNFIKNNDKGYYI